MFIENTTDKVKDLFQKFDELSENDQYQVAITIFEEWSNNQINSLNECNPNLLDDSVKIEIFNPESIGQGNEYGCIIAQYLFVILENNNIKIDKTNRIYTTLSNYMKYTDESKSFMSSFSKLSFIEKIDVITELIIRNEAEAKHIKYFDNCYEIASLILEYKKTIQ